MSEAELVQQVKENIAEAQRGLLLLEPDSILDVVDSALIMADGHLDRYVEGIDD